MATSNNQDFTLSKTQETFDELDATRKKELDNLTSMKEIQQQNLETEHKRLSEKYGTTHPRVQKITVQLAYNKGLSEGLAQEKRRSNVQTTPFVPDTWRIHGIVYDSQNAPQKGLTVFLTPNQEGAFNREFGAAQTNDQGYYSIALDKGRVSNIDNANATGKPLDLFLGVISGEQKRAVIDPDVLSVALNVSQYKDLTWKK